MKAETLKLDLIERLMKIQKASTLKRMNELITQAEMESRTQESIDAINKGEIVTLENFQKENQKWAKENYSKS